MECESTQRAYAEAVTVLSSAPGWITSEEYNRLREIERIAKINRTAATMALMRHQDSHGLVLRKEPQSAQSSRLGLAFNS
jgi:hypothetical protein